MIPNIKNKKKESPMIKKEAVHKYTLGDFAACLLEAVKRVHRFHLITPVYATHMVTGDLYPCLQEHADKLAEVWLSEGNELPEGPNYNHMHNINELLEHLKEEGSMVQLDKEFIQGMVDDACVDITKAQYLLRLG